MKHIEPWHRRHAIQIAAAVPEDIEDARTVLMLAKLLVDGFLAPPAAETLPENVFTLHK